MPPTGPMPTGERPLPALEERIASGFLFCVVGMQGLAVFSHAVALSAGRGGRVLYHVAFLVGMVHDLFVAIAVPGSLLWVARELLTGVRDIDPLLAAIVGTMWYGPERVQNSLTRIAHITHRWHLLRASLASYHRSLGGMTVVRRLRNWPWWAPRERQDEAWNGRVVDEDEDGEWLELSDLQLRSIARQGVRMALEGGADENDVRNWCAAIIADQARFPMSPLDDLPMSRSAKMVFGGHEGTRLRNSVLEIKEDWSEEEWSKLATAMSGIRREGLGYLRKHHWVVYGRV